MKAQLETHWESGIIISTPCDLDLETAVIDNIAPTFLFENLWPDKITKTLVTYWNTKKFEVEDFFDKQNSVQYFNGIPSSEPDYEEEMVYADLKEESSLLQGKV